jgi:hypothetical protein
LIGNFCFNSGQLVHSVELPYKTEYIADENFLTSGSEIDKVITGLRSHNFYTQASAVSNLRGITTTEINDSSQFLVGRNILQTAIGGEFSAEAIMNRLSTWLERFSIDGENHVLNGILYEIYFNAKGQFRQQDFKVGYFDKIFHLEENELYAKAFKFIRTQLSPFKDFLFYLPTAPPVALAIEIQFEAITTPSGHPGHKVISIKHEEVEYLSDYTPDRFYGTAEYTTEQFQQKLRDMTCSPKNRVRMSFNVPLDDIERIYFPRQIELSKQVEEVVEPPGAAAVPSGW